MARTDFDCGDDWDGTDFMGGEPGTQGWNRVGLLCEDADDDDPNIDKVTIFQTVDEAADAIKNIIDRIGKEGDCKNIPRQIESSSRPLWERYGMDVIEAERGAKYIGYKSRNVFYKDRNSAIMIADIFRGSIKGGNPTVDAYVSYDIEASKMEIWGIFGASVYIAYPISKSSASDYSIIRVSNHPGKDTYTENSLPLITDKIRDIKDTDDIKVTQYHDIRFMDSPTFKYSITNKYGIKSYDTTILNRCHLMSLSRITKILNSLRTMILHSNVADCRFDIPDIDDFTTEGSRIYEAVRSGQVSEGPAGAGGRMADLPGKLWGMAERAAETVGLDAHSATSLELYLDGITIRQEDSGGGCLGKQYLADATDRIAAAGIYEINDRSTIIMTIGFTDPSTSPGSTYLTISGHPEDDGRGGGRIANESGIISTFADVGKWLGKIRGACTVFRGRTFTKIATDASEKYLSDMSAVSAAVADLFPTCKFEPYGTAAGHAIKDRSSGILFISVYANDSKPLVTRDVIYEAGGLSIVFNDIGGNLRIFIEASGGWGNEYTYSYYTLIGEETPEGKFTRTKGELAEMAEDMCNSAASKGFEGIRKGLKLFQDQAQPINTGNGTDNRI